MKLFVLYCVFAALLLSPSDGVTNYCCRNADMGSDWCHTSSGCIGAGCEDDDAVECDDLSDCVCSEFLGSRYTIAACHVKLSCKNALNDFNEGRSLAENRLGTTLNDTCLQDLRAAVCAYHFPACQDDDNPYYSICAVTCDSLSSECGIALDEFVLVKDRCLAAATSSSSSSTDATTDTQCTSRANARLHRADGAVVLVWMGMVVAMLLSMMASSSLNEG